MDFGFVLSQSVTQAIGVTAIIYCLAAMGVNMQFGYAGLLNFGQVAFVAVGAYSIGVIVVTLGMNLWLAILVGLTVMGVLVAITAVMDVVLLVEVFPASIRSTHGSALASRR